MRREPQRVHASSCAHGLIWVAIALRALAKSLLSRSGLIYRHWYRQSANTVFFCRHLWQRVSCSQLRFSTYWGIDQSCPSPDSVSPQRAHTRRVSQLLVSEGLTSAQGPKEWATRRSTCVQCSRPQRFTCSHEPVRTKEKSPMCMPSAHCALPKKPIPLPSSGSGRIRCRKRVGIAVTRLARQ